MDPKDDHDDGEGQVDENYNPEEEVTGDYAIVNLPEIQTSTGEEEEDIVQKFRVKLYRWVGKEWKERGLGDFKLLQHKKSNLIRAIMRQEKTSKVVANFNILGENMCQLTQLKTNDKAWLWVCYDASDEKPSVDKLCAKFPNKEEAEKFKTEFEKAYKANTETLKKQKANDEKTEEKKE